MASTELCHAIIYLLQAGANYFGTIGLMKRMEGATSGQLALAHTDPHCSALLERALAANAKLFAPLVAFQADRAIECGWPVVFGLSSIGMKTRKLRRFLRTVAYEDPDGAWKLWDSLELDLQGIAIRLRAGHGEGDNQPRTRGRNPRCDPEKDRQLAEEWASDRAAGVSKKDFARAKHISLKELNRVLNRHAKRTRPRK